MDDEIGTYAKKLKPGHKAIVDSLRETIDAALPKSTSKVWHGHPVWFVGENPVVGYSTPLPQEGGDRHLRFSTGRRCPRSQPVVSVLQSR